jgi:hypothetical protein
MIQLSTPLFSHWSIPLRFRSFFVENFEEFSSPTPPPSMYAVHEILHILFTEIYSLKVVRTNDLSLLMREVGWGGRVPPREKVQGERGKAKED